MEPARRVLVTGASRGIGRAICEHLAAAGLEVVATARRRDDLDDLGQASTRLALDVTDVGSVRAALAAAGPIDALVNNAGVAVRGPIEAVPESESRRLFDVNVFGALTVSALAAPAMRFAGGGRIVFISSIAGRIGLPFAGVYSSSKFALEGAAQALRGELAPFGIAVSVVVPGLVDTGAFESSPSFDHADYAVPAGGVGDPSPATDVALAVERALVDRQPPDVIPVGRLAETLVSP